MANWAAGYVSDIGYTLGYYRELNPVNSLFPLLNRGIIAPNYRTACELGFGQGLSTNIHAAASHTEWYGTDFNPSQAGFARELTSVSKSEAKLYDESFQDFCSRNDLPDFDFIGIHGIWSWVSENNRELLVDFIRRKLSIGGVLYISYNTQPGWATFAPMRHLMTQHAESVGSLGGGTISKVDGAIKFAEQLLATNPIYSETNPQIGARIKQLKEQNRLYLAHEYFNRDWEPMHFSSIASRLESAKVDYACSSYCIDHLNSIHLTQDQMNFLQEISDPILKESVRDFMTNSLFRRDLWIKGRRGFTKIERLNAIREFPVLLCVQPNGLEINVTGSLGKATINKEIYDPIIDVLSDNKVKTIGEIEELLSNNTHIGLQEITESILTLIGTGLVATAQTSEETAAARRKTGLLNRHLMEKSLNGTEINYLASPVTGGGVPVNQLQQYFLVALEEGCKSTKELAEKTWERLLVRDQKLQVGDKKIESPEDNISKLRSDAEAFLEKELPILGALGIKDM